MYRVEDKFVCSERELFFLQKKLKTVLRPDKNQKNDDGYTITSVYFDDYADSHLVDTMDGNRFREKYRIRIYNGSYDTIKLEVKYKKDNKRLNTIRVLGIISLILITLNETFYKIDLKALILMPLITFSIPVVLYNDKDLYNINDSLYIFVPK